MLCIWGIVWAHSSGIILGVWIILLERTCLVPLNINSELSSDAQWQSRDGMEKVDCLTDKTGPGM